MPAGSGTHRSTAPPPPPVNPGHESSSWRSIALLPPDEPLVGPDSKTLPTHDAASGRLAGGRLELRRRIGGGGFGQVFAAWDSALRSEVAVKLLRRDDAEALYRFKREFRALADLRHPGLVALHELFEEDGRWFYTMELVDGEPFTVLGRQAQVPPEPTLTLRPGADLTAPGEQPPEWIGLADLASAVAQLVDAVEAIHAAGRLHRDLKPSNVLVDRSGRVVVLDFGLVGDRAQHSHALTMGVIGTPAYMAPEQAAGKPLTPAADWYAVGAIVFEALTGRRPFVGEPLAILQAKQRHPPADVRSFAADVPPAWADLVAALLTTDPERRAAGDDIRRQLGFVGRGRGGAAARQVFVGREAALSRLAALYEATARTAQGTDSDRASAGGARSESAPRVCVIRGDGGVGKSALLEEALRHLAARAASPLILRGRCYEREAIPFKALDGIVDALTRYLARLPESELQAIVPPDIERLVEVFPVLARVRALPSAGFRDERAPRDVHERRFQAFSALRELLAALARLRPVVLAIDDIHHADDASAGPLARLLSVDAPLLFIATSRTALAQTPALRLLSRDARDVAVEAMELEPLGPDEGAKLVRELWPDAPGPEQVAAVVARSRGIPLLLKELVERPPEASGGGPTSLAALLRARLRGLEPAARRLLDVLAVAGHPVPLSVAFEASSSGPAQLLPLRQLSLVQFTVRSGETVVACGSEALAAEARSSLDDVTRRALHRALAEGCEGVDRLHARAAEHWVEAGVPERAVRFAEAAAGRAEAALAFRQAAALRRIARDQAPAPRTAERIERTVRLASSLAAAGHAAEAAGELLAIRGAASEDQRWDIERRAAHYLLLSGHLGQGTRLLRELVEGLGARTPNSPVASLVTASGRIGWSLARLVGAWPPRVRSAPLSLRDQRRFEAYWTGATGLMMLDPVASIDYIARYLDLALSRGEPRSLAAGLAITSISAVSVWGERGRGFRELMLRRAAELAQAAGDPTTNARVALFHGVGCAPLAELPQCYAMCERAETTLRESCPDVAWELDIARIFRTHAAGQMGAVDRAAAAVELGLAQAAERGNELVRMFYSMNQAMIVDLGRDRPEPAERFVRDEMSMLLPPQFALRPYWRFRAEAKLALHHGDGARAWRAVEERWPAARDSGFMRSTAMIVEGCGLVARLAIVRLLDGPSPRATRAAKQALSRIRRIRVPWVQGYRAALEGALVAVGGEAGRAAGLLAVAEPALENAGFQGWATAAGRLRGELSGGATGEAMITRADERLRSLGVVSPARWARTLVPSPRR